MESEQSLGGMALRSILMGGIYRDSYSNKWHLGFGVGLQQLLVWDSSEHFVRSSGLFMNMVVRSGGT